MTITKEQWYAHPEFRQELEVLLKNPTLRAALDILRDQGMRSTIPVTGTDLIDYFAIQGAKKDGYISALFDLELLSKSIPVTPPARPPWETPKPDADKTSAP